MSGTEACAVEQHGDTVDGDDDKGVRVACPSNPLFNQLMQSFAVWPVNRTEETIPLNELSLCSSSICLESSVSLFTIKENL